AAEAGSVLGDLVVGDQYVAGERRRVDVQALHALPGSAALFRLDERRLPGLADVPDVHHVDAVVAAGGATPRGEERVTVPHPDIGDLLRNDVLQAELRDELDVRARPVREQVPLAGAVLVRVARCVGVRAAPVSGGRGRSRAG